MEKNIFMACVPKRCKWVMSIFKRTNNGKELNKIVPNAKIAIKFKKEYGIELLDAPKCFKKHETLFELSVNEFGAKYLPIVWVGNLFQRMERIDIKTDWDETIRQGLSSINRD